MPAATKERRRATVVVTAARLVLALGQGLDRFALPQLAAVDQNRAA